MLFHLLLEDEETNMQTTEYEALARELYRQRAELLKEFAQTEADLRILGEERESEWTDSAVEERLTAFCEWVRPDSHNAGTIPEGLVW